MVRGKEEKIIRWVLIIGIALLAELILANFSSLRLIREEKIPLINNHHIDESGKFILDNRVIDGRVKNIAVDISVTGEEYAELYVVVTDQGNKYEYAMPVSRIFPKVEETKYINLYPYGEVNTIYMEVTIPQGAEAVIHEIALNQPMRFSFKLIRCLIIAVILFMLLAKKLIPDYRIPDFDPKSRKQRVITLGIAILAGRHPFSKK